MLRAALLALPLLLVGTVAHADLRSPWALTHNDDDLRVALVTFGPGDAVHQYFGHNALLVEDRQTGVAVLYNFGMFGFGPDMLPKYLRGQLEFWAAATPVEATYAHYMADNRSIRVRELNLPPARRRLLADKLADFVLPENRTYLYHHYFNNCSTKLRDFIDIATSGQLKRATSGPGLFTFRGDTRRYTEHDPIIHMLLLLWMNDSMERPIHRWDEAFLPNELDRLVSETTIDVDGHKQPLSGQVYDVFEARRAPVPAAPGVVWPGLLAVGLLAGAVPLLLALWWRKSGNRAARFLLGLHHALMGLVVGIPGLVLFLFLFTTWDVTHWNENLFMANPITTMALPFGLLAAFGSRRGLRWVGRVWIALGASTALLLLLKLLPNFDQDTSLPMLLLVPLNLGCALAHLQLARQPARTAAQPAREAGHALS